MRYFKTNKSGPGRSLPKRGDHYNPVKNLFVPLKKLNWGYFKDPLFSSFKRVYPQKKKSLSWEDYGHLPRGPGYQRKEHIDKDRFVLSSKTPHFMVEPFSVRDFVENEPEDSNSEVIQTNAQKRASDRQTESTEGLNDVEEDSTSQEIEREEETIEMEIEPELKLETSDLDVTIEDLEIDAEPSELEAAVADSEGGLDEGIEVQDGLNDHAGFETLEKAVEHEIDSHLKLEERVEVSDMMDAEVQAENLDGMDLEQRVEFLEGSMESKPDIELDFSDMESPGFD